MKTIPIYNYIYFGTCIRFLKDCHVEMPLKKDGYIIDNLKSLFKYLDDLNLKVTQRTRAKIELEEIYEKFKKKDKDYKLDNDDAEKLSNTMIDLWKTIEAETEVIYVYEVLEKRFDIDKLLNRVNELFSPNTFFKLPKIAMIDFIESGKCIAFELPTASAFHSLRGTESVLRALYFSVKKRNRIKNLVWGEIIKDLEKCKTRKPPKNLIDTLDNIRINYRNPTQHPEYIYNIELAQDLFSLCISVVNITIDFLEKYKIDIIFQ